MLERIQKANDIKNLKKAVKDELGVMVNADWKK